jgi:hypothetical protein
MADAAHHQSSFLGGEWGPLSQGRSDLPAYITALSVSLNSISTEEGAWTRRSGFEFIVPTRSALPAVYLPFYKTSTTTPYVLELTNSVARFMVGTSMVFTSVNPSVTASSLSAGILSLTATTTNILVGDDLMLWAPTTFDPALIGPWRGRVLRVLSVGGGVITVGDEAGVPFVGLTSASNALVLCTLYQINHQPTPWTGQSVLQNLRIVPTLNTAIILSATVFPQLFDISAGTTFVNYPFLDGPYLDFAGTANVADPGNGMDPELGAVTGRSGSVTFTPTTTTFDANDIGRQIRLFMEPPAYNSGTTYGAGDTVTYQGGYWICLAAGVVGIIPGTPKTVGSVQTTVWSVPGFNGGGVWTWAIITAQTVTSCTCTIQRPFPTTCSLNVSAFRLGVYKIGQYPTCGIFVDGRLILGGAVPNRWDASMAGFTTIFSPTDSDGLVEDANGISYIMASKDPQQIMWMTADEKGLVMGTTTAEWLVASSTLNEALTPTSAKATEVTYYGSAFVEPVRAGTALVFVQTYGQRVMEHLSVSAFSSRFGARHLNEFAKHITAAGVVQIVYQEEKVPLVWARMTDGSLASCTYRRVSPYLTEAPVAEGWQRQVLGGDYNADLQRLVNSMAVRPGPDSLSDLLYVCTTDVNGAHAWNEVLRPIFEDA